MAVVSDDPTESNQTRIETVVEAWAQGLNVGAVFILGLIVLCNYRRGVLLHKLILLELFLSSWHGTFIFFRDPTYGKYLSITATLLYVSYQVHNTIAYMKIKPFLGLWGKRIFIGTLILVQPYWVLETWGNFEYFNELGHKTFEMTRYLETLMRYAVITTSQYSETISRLSHRFDTGLPILITMLTSHFKRDPWWVFTTVKLCVVIKNGYELTFQDLFKISPRFFIMLCCMFFSVIFQIVDLIDTALLSTQSGVNPYWRIAFVLKCASDTIFLDDFKSVLDHIVRSSLKRQIGEDFSLGKMPPLSNSTARSRVYSISQPNGMRFEHPIATSAYDRDGPPDMYDEELWMAGATIRDGRSQTGVQSHPDRGKNVPIVPSTDLSEKRRETSKGLKMLEDWDLEHVERMISASVIIGKSTSQESFQIQGDGVHPFRPLKRNSSGNKTLTDGNNDIDDDHMARNGFGRRLPSFPTQAKTTINMPQ